MVQKKQGVPEQVCAVSSLRRPRLDGGAGTFLRVSELHG